MKLWLLLFIITLLPVLVKSQQLPTKRDQYDFLKWYLSYKKMNSISDTTVFFDIALNEKYSMGRNAIRSLKFNAANIAYIKRQNSHNKKSLLDTANLPPINWHANEGHYYISIPVFSINKKIVLINWGYYCGYDCGKNGIEAYIKIKNGKWRPSKILLPIMVY